MSFFNKAIHLSIYRSIYRNRSSSLITQDHTTNFISIPNELKVHDEHKAYYYYFSHNTPQKKPTDVIPYQST